MISVAVFGLVVFVFLLICFLVMYLGWCGVCGWGWVDYLAHFGCRRVFLLLAVGFLFCLVGLGFAVRVGLLVAWWLV